MSEPITPEQIVVAQLIAHRACCGTEHDPSTGKLHGCCVVCGVPWPCKYAGTPLAIARVQERAKAAEAKLERVRQILIEWKEEWSDEFAISVPLTKHIDILLKELEPATADEGG